ncbi:GMP synthase-like glutamine amidotransferase [Bradyrhizobium sp. LB1.3]
MRGEPPQRLRRSRLEFGKRGTELNQSNGIDPFRQTQQNAVDHTAEQFLRSVAAASEQLHNTGKDPCAAVRRTRCDRIFQFNQNISRRICHHGRGLYSK